MTVVAPAVYTNQVDPMPTEFFARLAADSRSIRNVAVDAEARLATMSPAEIKDAFARIILIAAEQHDDVRAVERLVECQHDAIRELRNEGLTMAQETNAMRDQMRALEDQALRAVQLDDVSIASLAPRRAVSGE